MDAIKKKMEKLSNETATAEARIAHFEDIKVSYHQGVKVSPRCLILSYPRKIGYLSFIVIHIFSSMQKYSLYSVKEVQNTIEVQKGPMQV